MADRTVSEIMTRRPGHGHAGDRRHPGAQLMVDNKIGALPVFDGGRARGPRYRGRPHPPGREAGVPHLHPAARRLHHVSAGAGEVRERVEEGSCGDCRRRDDEDPITVQADTSIEDVATLLVERDVSRIPVMNGDSSWASSTKGDVVARSSRSSSLTASDRRWAWARSISRRSPTTSGP